jgi:hypothetical protein
MHQIRLGTGAFALSFPAPPTAAALGCGPRRERRTRTKVGALAGSAGGLQTPDRLSRATAATVARTSMTRQLLPSASLGRFPKRKISLSVGHEIFFPITQVRGKAGHRVLLVAHEILVDQVLEHR